MMRLVEMAANWSHWRTLQHLCTYEDFRTSSYLSGSAEFCILFQMLETPLYSILEEYNLSAQSPVLTEVMPLIDWEHHAKKQSFTELHRIVSRISGVSIDVELQDSVAINELDLWGRSALWFAVQHRSLTHVRKLVEQGADPNIGNPPLWTATAGQSSYDITKLLLDHGASPDPDLIPACRDGWLPWSRGRWIGDWSGDSFAIDRLLIRSGISINHQAGRGETILMYLSSSPSLPPSSDLQRLKQLIRFGADLEISDEEGETAIMYAVMGTSPDAFRFLAGVGARLDLKTLTGSTILHLAIARTLGDYESNHVNKLCEAMHDTDLTSVDLEAKDEDGNTAYDLLRIRNGPNWDGYCRSKDRISWDHYDEDWRVKLEVIEPLETLLHHVQEIQGVPEADRYPPLCEYGSRDPEDQAVPGAWPTYED